MKINLKKKFEPLFKPSEDIRYVFLYGGRAGAKSFTSSLWLALRLIQAKNQNLVYCRQYMTNVETSIIPEFLDKISILGINGRLKILKDKIKDTVTGNCLFFKGLEKAEGTAEAGLKGIPRLSTILIDEMQEVKEADFDRLCGTLRDKGISLKIVCALNPTSTTSFIYKRFFADLPTEEFSGIVDNRLYIYTSYEDCTEYLSQQYLDEINNLKEKDYLKWLNQYKGHWASNLQNALFKQEHLELAHREPPKEIIKTIIAIDPAVTANKSSDATGIVVISKTAEKDFIIEEEKTRSVYASGMGLDSEETLREI